MAIKEKKLKSGKVVHQARVYVKTDEKGNPVLKNKNFESKKEAKEFVKRLDDFKKNRIDRSVSDKTLFSVVFDAYIEKTSAHKKDNTIRAYKGAWRNWIEPHLGMTKVGDITPLMLSRFFTLIKKDGASDYLVRYVHILLFDILKFASESFERYIVENPLAGMPRARLEYNPTDSIKFWNKKNAEKFLKTALGSDYYLIFTIMLNTGIRVSEMAALTESSFDIPGRKLHVKTQLVLYQPRKDEEVFESQMYNVELTKNRAARVIQLTDSALEAAKLAIKKNQEKGNYFLFSPERKSKKHKVIIKRGPKCQTVETEVIIPRTVGNVIASHCKKAGVQNIGPHGLRHTFASNFLMNGGDIFTLSRILGHKNITSTQIYIHLTEGFLKSAMNIVEFGG